MNFVYMMLIGLVAGWLAGQILKGSGFGLLGDLIIGLLGAVLGGFLFSILGLIENSIIGELISATVGAILLLYLLRFLKSK